MIELVLLMLPMFFLIHFLFGAWRNQRGILLVEDHMYGTITYYWESIQGQALSQKFNDLDEAKRWWLQRQFKSYKHTERRKRLRDRRMDTDSRSRFEEGSFALDMGVGGRRRTDHEIISKVIRKTERYA